MFDEFVSRPFLLVGLGNPGPQYEKTRHNVGFRMLDQLADAFAAGPEEDGPGYRLSRAQFEETDLVLVRPLTYMNRSGEALDRIPESAIAGPERHLIMIDDISLPFGAIRFRARGSSGGQKGLASVLQHLGTEEVPRLRLGVGDRDRETDLRDYVLEGFSVQEEKLIEPWLNKAVEGVKTMLSHSIQKAMSLYNSIPTNQNPEELGKEEKS